MKKSFSFRLLCLVALVAASQAVAAQEATTVITSPPAKFSKKGTDTVDSTLSLPSLGSGTEDSVLTLMRPTGPDPSNQTDGDVTSTPSGNGLPPPATSYDWSLIASDSHGGFGGMGPEYYTCDWTPPGFSQIGNDFSPGICSASVVGKRYYCSNFVPQSNDNLQDDTYECTAR